MKITQIRKIIKERFPELTFKLRTVGFADLARDKAVFLESPLWGMCKGNADLFQAVKAYVEYKKLPVIVSF
jgi:hypothetical protein